MLVYLSCWISGITIILLQIFIALVAKASAYGSNVNHCPVNLRIPSKKARFIVLKKNTNEA